MSSRQIADTDSDRNAREAPSLGWLVAGACVGLLAAAYGLLERADDGAGLPEHAVARVGEALITADEFERSVARLESSYGQTLDDAQRARVLEQIIDEELLVQRGIELGMPASESTVRTAIVQSLIASVTADADAADPDDETLRAFYNENASDYTYASAMTLEAWVTDDQQLALAFVEGGGAEAAPGGLQPLPGLPTAPAPPERLRMFVGPAIAAAAADMPVGEARVFARQGRWYVVRVKRRDASTLADLDSVRSQVLLDYRRDLADRRLAAYVDDLRTTTGVVVALPP